MTLEFRRGDRDRPRGHALAYFDGSSGQILATYLVVPPIVIDLGKYIPPMFAGHLPVMSSPEPTGMPLPPVPEEFSAGLAGLERLAEQRDDDLVYCGRVDVGQLERLLMGATEAGGQYAQLYRAWLDRSAATEIAPPDELDVDTVMLSLMGDHQRIAEISKLIGRLRYAIEMEDPGLTDDAVAEIERVVRYLPEKYRADELVAAARRPGAAGVHLAELHVQRCLKLAAEEYADAARIDAEIKRLT